MATGVGVTVVVPRDAEGVAERGAEEVEAMGEGAEGTVTSVTAEAGEAADETTVR